MFNTSFSFSVSEPDVVSANAELKLKVNITATAVEVFGVRIAREKDVFEVILQGILLGIFASKACFQGIRKELTAWLRLDNHAAISHFLRACYRKECVVAKH